MFVGHQQRAAARSETGRRPRRADGLPRVERRVPLAADAREARGRTRQRLAVSGRRLVAARRGRTAVLREQSRRRLLSRHQRVPRQRERRPVHGRDAQGAVRCRRDLELRHARRGRLVSAQPVELVTGRLRRSHLPEHVERPGREPRPHPVAAGAVDHRDQQDHREAGVGGQLGRGPHPARAVVDAGRRDDRRRAAGRVGTG